MPHILIVRHAMVSDPEEVLRLISGITSIDPRLATQWLASLLGRDSLPLEYATYARPHCFKFKGFHCQAPHIVG